MKQIGQIIQQGNSVQTMQHQSLPDSQQKTTLVRKHGERETFLTKYNPTYQMQICDNAEECLFGDYPSLAEVRIGYGNNAPKMWLIPQLYDLSEYCGVKDKLQGVPLEETAFVIATEYYYLKISEIMLFFHRFKAGRYGRFYGNVDPLVITTALHTFIRERNVMIDHKEQEERERKQAEDRKQAVTWDEYCKMKHIESANPFQNITNYNQDKHGKCN